MNVGEVEDIRIRDFPGKRPESRSRSWRATVSIASETAPNCGLGLAK